MSASTASVPPPHPTAPHASSAPNAPRPDAAPGPAGGRALTTFAVLWALAALFHEAAHPGAAFGLSGLLVTLPAIWLLLRPASVGRLLLLATLQVAQAAARGFASISDQWLLTTFVNLAIILAFAWLALRHRAAPGADALFRGFAPAARLNLLVAYFYAVFHKLNRDFLDPAVSCATTQYGPLRAAYPALPSGPWASHAVIYGTLAVGALVPPLLVWRRTRVAGVLLAGALHYALALDPRQTGFEAAALLFALYFLFVPFDYFGAFRLRERAARPWLRATAQALLAVLAAVLVGAYLARLGPRRQPAVDAMVDGARGLFAVYGAVVLALFASAARRADLRGAGRGLDALRPRPALLALVPALLVVNGLTPYLGLKTQAAFARFSNLRTEGGVWNHLVLPPAMRVASYQDDLVRLLDSSDPGFRSEARRGSLIPFFELRARAVVRPNASVVYERAGRVYRVARIADAPELTPPTRLQRTFLRFRAVAAPGATQSCRR